MSDIQNQQDKPSNKKYIFFGIAIVIAIGAYFLISSISKQLQVGSASDTDDTNKNTPNPSNIINPNNTNSTNPTNTTNTTNTTNNPINTTPKSTVPKTTNPPINLVSNVTIVSSTEIIRNITIGRKPLIQNGYNFQRGNDTPHVIYFPEEFETDPIVNIDCINSMHTDNYIFMGIIDQVTRSYFTYNYYYFNLGSPAFLNTCPDDHIISWSACAYVSVVNTTEMPSVQYNSVIPTTITPVPTPTFYNYNVFSVLFDVPFTDIPSVNLIAMKTNSFNTPVPTNYTDKYYYFPMLTEITKIGFKYRYFRISINSPSNTEPCSDPHIIKYFAIGNVSEQVKPAYIRWGTSDNTGNLITMNGSFFTNSILKISLYDIVQENKIFSPILTNIGGNTGNETFTYKNIYFLINSPTACRNAEMDHTLNWLCIDDINLLE